MECGAQIWIGVELRRLGSRDRKCLNIGNESFCVVVFFFFNEEKYRNDQSC